MCCIISVDAAFDWLWHFMDFSVWASGPGLLARFIMCSPMFRYVIFDQKKRYVIFWHEKKYICVILLTKKKRYVIFLTKRKICVIFNSFFSKLFCLLNYFNVYIRKNMYFNLFGSIDKWLVKSPLARGLIKKIWNAHYKF